MSCSPPTRQSFGGTFSEAHLHTMESAGQGHPEIRATVVATMAAIIVATIAATIARFNPTSWVTGTSQALAWTARCS